MQKNSLKMGEMPMGKLLFIMSGPAILSMLVQSLYNVVDSIFVAKISGNATTALSLAFPMQMLVMAFAFGIGVGSNSVIARRLGEGRVEDASKTAQNGLFMAVCMGLFWAVCGYFVAKIFISAYVNTGEYADPEAVITYGVRYLAIVMCCCLPQYIDIFANKVLQSTGNMIIPMIAQLIGAITNIILDPILIFDNLSVIGINVPGAGLGVSGAAIATVAGQFVSMIFTLCILKMKEQDVDVFFKKGFRPNGIYVKEVLRVGIPVAIMNSVASVTTASLNAILSGYGEAAISVLGVYFKLQSFIFMPVFGLCQGAMPILGYNYGANKRDRFVKAYALSTMIAVVIMVIGVLLFTLVPDKMLSLFKPDGNTAQEITYFNNLLTVGTTAFKIICVSFIPAAFCIIMINMLQAVGKGFVSMVSSLFRQLILLIPAALILSKVGGLDATWWCYPIGEIGCLAVFMPYAFALVKRLFDAKKPIPDGKPLIIE